mgnify:CR=1 FL=1
MNQEIAEALLAQLAEQSAAQRAAQEEFVKAIGALTDRITAPSTTTTAGSPETKSDEPEEGKWPENADESRKLVIAHNAAVLKLLETSDGSPHGDRPTKHYDHEPADVVKTDFMKNEKATMEFLATRRLEPYSQPSTKQIEDFIQALTTPGIETPMKWNGIESYWRRLRAGSLSRRPGPGTCARPRGCRRPPAS